MQKATSSGILQKIDSGKPSSPIPNRKPYEKTHLEKELAYVLTMPRMLGQKEVVRYLKGERLTASQRLKGVCNYCMGYFPDGKDDCGNDLCPAYPKRFYHGIHAWGEEPKDEPKRGRPSKKTKVV